MAVDAIVGVMTAIVTAGSALLGAYVNGRMQERKARGDHLQQLSLEGEKRRWNHSNNVLQELKDARLALCRVRRETSMTMSFITFEEEMTPQVYNRRYVKLLADLDRIEVAIDCWAPELRPALDKLRGAHSCFWGEQQHLLYLQRRPDDRLPGGGSRSRAVQEARAKIATIARDAEPAVVDLRRGMSEAHMALLA